MRLKAMRLKETFPAWGGFQGKFRVHAFACCELQKLL